MSSRDYLPVMVQIERWLKTGVVVWPQQSHSGSTIFLPFEGQSPLLQHVDHLGFFVKPYDPSALTCGERADLMLMASVIAWVPRWKHTALIDQGFDMPTMFPPSQEALTL